MKVFLWINRLVEWSICDFTVSNLQNDICHTLYRCVLNNRFPCIQLNHLQNYILFFIVRLLENSTTHLPLIWKWIDLEQWVIMLSIHRECYGFVHYVLLIAICNEMSIGIVWNGIIRTKTNKWKLQSAGNLHFAQWGN